MTVSMSTSGGAAGTVQLFKQKYGDLVNKAIPEFSIVSEAVPFSQQNRLGDSYVFPIRVFRSHGYTFASGDTAGDAFALNAVNTGSIRKAQLAGSSFVLREAFSYKAVLSGTGNNDMSFTDVFDEGIKDMFNSSSAWREITLLHGNGTLGQISAVSNSSGTVTTTLTAASSSLGLWAQLENAKVDVYALNLSTKRNNTAGCTVTVSRVDYDSTTNQVTMILTFSVAGDAANIAANDYIVPYGGLASWFSGIDAIATNTGSLFGIDAATYSIWKASSQSASNAQLTMATLTKAAAQVAQRTNAGGTMTCMVSIPTWADLNNNIAALRRLPGNDSKVELGAKSIVFHGPTGGLEIVAHPFMKNSDAFILDWKQFTRVGATDITFDLGVDGQNSNFFQELASNAGFEVRCMWDQAIVCKMPRTICKISNIVNAV